MRPRASHIHLFLSGLFLFVHAPVRGASCQSLPDLFIVEAERVLCVWEARVCGRRCSSQLSGEGMRWKYVLGFVVLLPAVSEVFVSFGEMRSALL